MALFPETQPDTVLATIGFRVECHDEHSSLNNAALGRGGVGELSPRGDARRQLQGHEDELLVQGAISADEYRIMACLAGNSTIVESVFLDPVPSHIASLIFQALVPRGVFGLDQTGEGNGTDALRAELHGLSGQDNDLKLCVLVLVLSRQDWAMMKTQNGIEIIVKLPLGNLCVLRFTR